jgi:hypothetical protein
LVVKIVQVPAESKDRFLTEAPLRPSDLEYLDESALCFVYSYFEAEYEGAGYGILLTADKEWWVYSLAHCSCNEPLSEYDCATPPLLKAHDKRALTSHISAELKAEILPLIEALEKECGV